MEIDVLDKRKLRFEISPTKMIFQNWKPENRTNHLFFCHFLWHLILKIKTRISVSSCPPQWNTSRRCQPSLRAPGPLGPPSPGTHPPPHPRKPLSPRPWRWRSHGSSRWRCARCRGNSALRTRRTGRACWEDHSSIFSISLFSVGGGREQEADHYCLERTV